jgi:hypothetical protein
MTGDMQRAKRDSRPGLRKPFYFQPKWELPFTGISTGKGLIQYRFIVVCKLSHCFYNSCITFYDVSGKIFLFWPPPPPAITKGKASFFVLLYI